MAPRNLRLKVLLVDDSPERTEILRVALEKARYNVAAVIESPLELLRAVEDHQPDAIIIDTESPARDVLEHVVMVSRDQPRPIVMFSSDGASDSIRNAVRAGVSAYVLDGLDAARVQGIVEVAVARFDEYQRLVASVVLPYAANKADIVEDLQASLTDNDAAVRAQAVRALTSLALLERTDPATKIRVSATWFIDMLQSLTWSDRTQAAHALDTLTKDSAAPLQPDASGRYPVPRPGIEKQREY